MVLLGITSFLVLVLFLVSCHLKFLTCAYTITPTKFIRDPDAVTSEGSVFKLGFFSPLDSANRYVAIWYNQVSVVSVIWVANRDRPLKDSSGTVRISEDGNIMVSNGQNEASQRPKALLACSFDSGNLVLQEIDSRNNSPVTVWESFGHPTDSFLTSMKITNGEGKEVLRSWKSSSNPSAGNFSADKNRKVEVIILATVIPGAVAASVFSFFLHRWMAKSKASMELLLSTGEKAYRVYSGVNRLFDETEKMKLHDLPLYTFGMLVTATNNFDLSNLLGQGGFGPVYKRKMPNGQEIAVKRLSSASRQGLQEFMNEVVVISKLQHRSLVRLHGCCVEGDERILIYKYLPNKSLDAILFDPLTCHKLDWRKRQSIITEIAQGILYLHRDSRLRIIHRDLKASNLLLDEGLHPKMLDFRLARIFGGNQDQAKTRIVVRTYGYMSPEYVIHGRFSEKSDVYSFGVLLLEILSGRCCTSFHPDDQTLSLLGFAWKSWTEENMAAFDDTVIYAPTDEIAILRCIHVGLLCLQEQMKDRPSMSTIVSMLNSKILDLPSPKPPAFTITQVDVNTQQDQKPCSVNNLTDTIVEAR
ncbi:hypothetical protein NL676_013018 [Syzygium grande]|nr:hypothetical protein NL676_013018 [Syzygium grande]